MKVHIFGEYSDYHSMAVRWGLEKLGIDCNIIPTISYKEEQSITFSYPEKSTKVGSCKINQSDVAWLRRPLSPIIHPDTPTADKRFAHNEYKQAFFALFYKLESLRLCVNPYSIESKIESKPLQLELAINSGLSVPRTLMTNNPENARSFLSSFPGQCIYKAFTPHAWESKDGNSLSQAKTFKVRLEDLSDNFVIQSAPLILQEYVEKEFDTRVVVMGNTMIAAAIVNKQKSNEAPVDWRAEYYYASSMSILHIEIPKKVQECILRFMKSANIVYSCLDFSVDKEGNWWFLESNAAGQFLWMHDKKGDINLLSQFCSFLASGDSNYDGFNTDPSISLSEFEKSEAYEELKNTKSVNNRSLISIE